MTQNITILGGGIMGLMTAYMLAQDTNTAHTITIIDPKGFPADNASLMAGGMLAPYSEIEHMGMDWVNAGLAGIEIWRDTNLDTGFSQKGSLLIAHPEDRYILERFKSHLQLVASSGFEPTAPQSIESNLPNEFQSGLFLKEEAHLDPAKTMTALCDHLRNHKNVALNTNALTHAPTDITIDCRGMATNDPDLRGVKGEILIVHNPEFTLDRPVRLMHPRYPLYIVPRDNHTFMIGATIIESSDNETVSLRSSMELMSALYALHPSFADAEIIELKAGIRPSYPNNLPRITITDSTISCNGLFRHGYLLSPIMAKCVRDNLNGKENEYMSLFLKGDSDAKITKSHNQRAA